MYEPLITEEISIDKLKAVLDSPFTFPKLPLHSTSVERAVRLVTNASSQVISIISYFIIILKLLFSKCLVFLKYYSIVVLFIFQLSAY
jgi:hypothetical protein